MEILQKQIDDIKIDLEKLKTETSVDQKKIQARNIETDVTTAKEAIKKELEALKSKTDEESIANKTKLEKMFATLETMETSSTDLTELKADIAKSAETQKSSEKIDNTLDFWSITTGIATIKTLVTELQTIINEYLKQKTTMGEPEKKVKEQEIEAKKVAIEAKRKEVQDIIDKIRKWRKDVKIEDITDADIKKIIIEQKAKEEALLVTYEIDLKTVETPATTTREKVKSWVEKTRGKVKETADKAREWGKKNPVPAIAATAGVGLLIRGISKLFSKKKKEASGDDEKKDKKEKKGVRDYIKTGLKRWAVGTGIWFLWKWLLTGKRPRSKTEGTGADVSNTMTSTENAAESFEKLLKDKPKEAEKLNVLGNKVNDVYDEVYKFNDGTMPTWLEDAKLGKWKEKYEGAIPHILENQFAKIDDMEGQRWLFTICTYGTITEIKKAFSGLIAKWCTKLVSGVLWMFGIAWIIDDATMEAKVDEFVWWKNSIDEIHMVFRKILKVMSYTNYLENAYLAREVELKAKAWKTIYKKEDDKYVVKAMPTDVEKIKELINDMQYNPSEYKIGEEEISKIRDDFRNKKLSEVFEYNIDTKDILKYNYDIAKDIKSINDKRDTTLKDFDKDPNGTLDKIKNGAEDEIADGFWESSKKLFPFLHMTELSFDKTAVKKKIKEDAWFKKMLEDFTIKFEELKKETDTTKAKKSIDEYYATLKELYTTQNSIADMTDKNGNIVTRGITAFTSVFTWTAYCFSHGAELAYEGQYLKSATWIYGWCASVSVLWNITGFWKNWVVSLATTISKAPFKLASKALPKTLMLAKVTDYIPTPIAQLWYNSAPEIAAWIGRGLSYGKAFKIYNALSPWWEVTRWFFTEVLKIQRDEAFITRLEKIVFSNGEVTKVWEKFLNEAITKPWLFSAKKTIQISDILPDILNKYEGIVRASAEYQSAISNIVTVAKTTENLGDITTLAGNYTNLLTKADDVNSLTYKILQQWWTADGDAAKYLTDVTQIGKAKAYAEKVIELRGWTEWAVETTKIGEAWKWAKTMFKEWMDKIKGLFNGNKTISPAQESGLNEWITNATNQTEKISEETFEAATKNPTGEEAKTVANAMQGKIGLWTRVLKWSPLLIDGVINIFNGVGLIKEAAEIKKINVERASVREEKATFTLTLAGAELTVFAVWVAMSWNPAGRIILAVTAGIEAVKYGANKYYEVVETYYRNFEDFKRMCMAQIKQEIISKEAWGDGIEISLQENFQESVSAVFGSRCHGEGKKTLSLKTREDAIRALIWMEECENYPYATLNLEWFKWTGYTALQTEVNKESDAMKADSVVRFNYIKQKYGDKFIAKDKIISANAKTALDSVLLESRQYLKMTKDTTTKATDIPTYQAEILNKLKENAWFTKLEALYVSSPLQFHKIMKSLPYYNFMFQQLNKETYVGYDQIKTNMEYVVQFYNCKTFWLLPSDIPDITVDANKVDYSMMEAFFKDLTVNPTGFTKEEMEAAFAANQIDIMTPDEVEMQESISSSVGQNILYRVAKEVLWWYRWKNTLDDLKAFYVPSEKSKNGIYYEDGTWYVNNTFRYRNFLAGSDQSICKDEELNDVTKVGLLFEKIRLATWFDKGNYFTNTNKDNARYSLIEVETWTNQENINKEYGTLMNNIITEELAYRTPENIAKYKKAAEEYIKAKSNDTYIPLTSDMINNLTRAGIENTGYYYYKWDGTKLVALEAVVGAIPAYLANKTCGLTNNTEQYAVKEVAYSSEIKDKVATIDWLVAKLSSMMVLDDEDLDIQEDIKKMIAAKWAKRLDIKNQLSHMDQNKAKELLDPQYDEFQMFFENTYIMILHCASSGTSNDVDTYDDYLSISSSVGWSLLEFRTDAWTMQTSVAIPEFDYTDEFNATILKYQIPGKNKTIPDLLNSKEVIDVVLGKKYAYAVLRSVLESATIKYDDSGTTQTWVCNAGAQDVDEKLLNKRLAINTKDIK